MDVWWAPSGPLTGCEHLLDKQTEPHLSMVTGGGPVGEEPAEGLGDPTHSSSLHTEPWQHYLPTDSQSAAAFTSNVQLVSQGTLFVKHPELTFDLSPSLM